MRTMMLALIALGAMLVPGAAQTPKPAAGSPEIFWVFTLKVQPDQFDQLKPLVTEIVAAGEKDPGVLEYDWNISADHNTLVVVERYADSKALVQHGGHFHPFAKRFFALATPTSLVVFGAPDAEAKKAIAGLNPVYMTTFDGFSR
jgi:quinol monooxygenase YgiN